MSSPETKVPPQVVADECSHLANAVWIDGGWRTPHLCRVCINKDRKVPMPREKEPEVYSSIGRALNLFKKKLRTS